jgi:hypothetical protein
VLVLGIVAAWPLYALIVWLASSAFAAYLSERKGYGDKPGLACGLVFMVVGPIVWLLVPAREGSDWKVKGAFGNPKGDERP